MYFEYGLKYVCIKSLIMEMLIFTLLAAAYLWWEQWQTIRVAEKMDMASKDANFFIESILQQGSLDETLEVFQFCACTFTHWEGRIPDKTFRYHAKAIVEAYIYKIDQLSYINLN